MKKGLVTTIVLLFTVISFLQGQQFDYDNIYYKALKLYLTEFGPEMKKNEIKKVNILIPFENLISFPDTCNNFILTKYFEESLKKQVLAEKGEMDFIKIEMAKWLDGNLVINILSQNAFIRKDIVEFGLYFGNQYKIVCGDHTDSFKLVKLSGHIE